MADNVESDTGPLKLTGKLAEQRLAYLVSIFTCRTVSYTPVYKTAEEEEGLLEEIGSLMTNGQIESLGQLALFGPVWDGDILSKVTRDFLIKLRLASRVLVEGRSGYTASTNLGGRVYETCADRVKPNRVLLRLDMGNIPYDEFLIRPLDTLSNEALVRRFEAEETEAVELMKRAELTRKEIHKRGI